MTNFALEMFIPFSRLKKQSVTVLNAIKQPAVGLCVPGFSYLHSTSDGWLHHSIIEHVYWLPREMLRLIYHMRFVQFSGDFTVCCFDVKTLQRRLRCLIHNIPSSSSA